MEVRVRRRSMFDKGSKKIDSSDIEAFSYPRYEGGYSMLIYYDKETRGRKVFETDGDLEDLGRSYFSAIALELLKSPITKKLFFKVLNDTSMDEKTKEEALYDLSILPCMHENIAEEIDDSTPRIKKFKEEYLGKEFQLED